MYTYTEDCDFGGLKRERIRDQFITGITDEKLQEKLENFYVAKPEDFTLERVCK